MTTSLMTDINKRLKSIRLQRGYKQKEIADLLGLHISTYGKIELGEIGIDVPKAQKLAKLYKVSLDELVGEIEDNAIGIVKEDSSKNSKKRNRKPIRLYIELDPEAEEDKLPNFFMKLQKLIQEENEED